MRSRSIGQALVLPFATAFAIITILFFLPHASFRTVKWDRSFARQKPTALPNTNNRTAPWTLADEQKASGVPSPVAASIPQRYYESTTGQFRSGIGVHAPAPRSPISIAILQAPVVLEEIDLAGLRPWIGNATQTASTKQMLRSSATNGTSLARRSLGRRHQGWPETPELDDRLQRLITEPKCQAWCESTISVLTRLRALPTILHSDSEEVLTELRSQAKAGIEAAEASTEVWPVRSTWLRAAYSVQRRAEVWQSILTSQSLDHYRLTTTIKPKKYEVKSLVGAVRNAIKETGDESGWNRFLLLSEIEIVVAKSNFDSRQVTAQRFLSRVDGYQFNSYQKTWVSNEHVKRLADTLRPWAAEPLSVFDLLEQIETYEGQPNDESAAQLALAIQSLRHSEQPELVEVAAQLNDHYRNANFRVSVTGAILDRLLPEPKPQQASIRQQILGASVRGQSQVHSTLGLRLIPATEAWHLRLLTAGQIQNQTVSVSGPAELHHSGTVDFRADTDIQVSREGVRIQQPRVDIDSNNHLQSVASDFDALPIIGPFVRAIVVSRHDESRREAKSIADGIAQREIAEKVDAEVRAAATQAEQKVVQRLIGPLASMDLKPLVIGLQTTDERLQVRYRVAGDYQLAASSPRPRAWSNSLCSVQVHESTINNLLEQTLVSEDPLTLMEMWTRAVGAFGAEPPKDLPEDVRLQFTPSRPVTLRFDHDQVELNLRIAVMLVEGHIFRDFNIRVVYRTEADGLTARLVRDGTVSIQGDRLGTRDRLPIRVIFNKVFNEQRKPSLIHSDVATDPRVADLTINQLETRDGWFAMALAPASSTPRIARLPLP